MALDERILAYFYLAPIESGGRVVAVVYGDDLPGDSRPGDTSALKVALHDAGLALDGALAEAEGDLAG